MKNLCLISLGCSKNLVDSEVMLAKLSHLKLVESPKNADIIIINTCGFIASAKSESIQAILEVARIKKNGAMLVVSGCLSARYKDELQSEIKEIDLILGVGEFDKIDELLNRKSGAHTEIKSNKTFLINKEERVITGSKIHAYIKISEGCNQKCSFCAIPLIKGRLQSRKLESIIDEVKRLVARGYVDFSFISQDSSSYLKDYKKNDGLISLIRAIDGISGVRSARILYLYPSTTSLDLINAIGESRVFASYFDMPLQHASNNMLKIMQRGADKSRCVKLLEAMRKINNNFIRTSFLLGHPGESERDFSELCEFVDDFNFDRVNIFGFSSESGTKAHTMKNIVTLKTTNERIKKLDKIIQTQQSTHFKAYDNKKIEAIIDGISKQSELLFSARDLRWDREIDGEILINDSVLETPLNAGYYEIETKFSNGILLGKALRKI